MKKYKNYIFDFYGTLVDIVTDETKLDLWEKLAAVYNSFGCSYGARQLRNAFYSLTSEEEVDLIRTSPHQYVEIDLENVFLRLYTEAESLRQSETAPTDLKTFSQSVAAIFRVLSREKLEIFANTLTVLQKLKDEGARLIIMSNAQRIFTQSELELTGCANLVEKIYLSSDYQMKKPDADFLQLVLEENQLNPEETVVVGNDLSADIAIAQTAGIDGILLNTFPYSWDEIEAYRSKGWNFAIINDILELLD
ncbi:TPA: HAD family hydrolase [Streptococcus suis]|nr:HAD family hydrolase [Streptococcus suis]